MNKLQNVSSPPPPPPPLGTKRSLSDQSLAVHRSLGFEEGTRDENHKQKKIKRVKYIGVQNKWATGKADKKTSILGFGFCFFVLLSECCPKFTG